MRSVLDNGLVVLTRERPGARAVAILIMYRAGAFFDPEGLSGLAHLTEHMMFRGTPSFPHGRIDAVTGRLGGTNNAMTTADHALYYFVLPAGHWRLALEIEADRMLNCPPGELSFEVEKRVAAEERMMLDDDPETLIYEAVDALAFGGHPYGRPVAGSLEDIRRITSDDVHKFYRRHYSPANAVLAVVGDLTHEDVSGAAGELFGSAPSGRRAEFLAEAPVPDGTRVAGLRCGRCQARVLLAFPCPSASHPDSPAMELLAAHLASGRGSVLHAELVRGRGVASDVTASRLMQTEPGLFYLGADLHDDVGPGDCEELLLAILGRVRDDGLTSEELVRARNLTRVDTLLSQESCLGSAGALAFWESLGSWELEGRYDRGLDETDCEAVSRVAERYLSPDLRSTAWLVPD